MHAAGFVMPAWNRRAESVTQCIFHIPYSMFPLRRTRYTQGFETTAHRMNFQIPPALPALELDVFARAASQGETLYVTKAGEQFQVIASGTTPSGRNVSWVATDEDTLVMFSSALALAYGTGIARAVAKELDLHAAPTTSLSARVVTRAVDMAETSRHALQGVDFLTFLSWSARADTAGFRQVCHDTGVSPDQISGTLRATIDESMQQRFASAAQSGKAPVSAHTAQEWLREVLAHHLM